MKAILPAIAVSLLSVGAQATTYYVANGGNNSNTGLVGSPWETVSKVNSRSFAPGDRILFNRGDTWSEQLLIPSSGSAAGGYITFGAYGAGDLPVFDGTGVSLLLNHGLIRGSTKNYIIVENIRVQDSGVGAGLKNSGIGFYQGDHIIVQDCQVYNTEEGGIKFNGSSNVGVFRNNVSRTNCNGISEQISIGAVDGFEVAYNESYSNCATSGGAGIDSKQGSTRGSIHHNYVHDILDANGVYADAFNATTSDIAIYNNLIVNIDNAGIQIGSESDGELYNVYVHHNIVKSAARGAFCMHDTYDVELPNDAVHDIYVYNNTFIESGSGTTIYGGVRIWDRYLTSVTFKNNIIANNANFQIGYSSAGGYLDGSEITADYNNIYGPQSSASYVAIAGSHTISGDPLLNDPDNGDYSLAPGSPAKYACDSSVWSGTANVVDYNGEAITDGSGNIVVPGGVVSCGAIEAVSGDTVPNAPEDLQIISTPLP